MRRNLLIALAAILLLAALAWGQGGDPRPNFQGLPIWAIDTSNNFVKVGDLTNHAVRVNVIAGSAGGPSANIGATFPVNVAPIGVADSTGFVASLTLTNNRLNVTCDNCGGSTFNDNSAFTAGVSTILNVGAVFNDGLAAVTSGNAAAPRITAQRGLHVSLRSPAGTALETVNGILHVIASQGESNAAPWNANVAQWLGSTAPTVGQKTMASSLPVALASDQAAVAVSADTSAATGTIAPARVQMLGGTGQSANPSRVIACDSYASIALANNTTTLLITGSATQLVYICSINLVVSSATAVNLVEGIGSFCNTNVQGIFGGTATASGWNLASNGGLTQGTGIGMIGKTVNTGNNVCLQHSTAATLAGGITWTKF